MKHIREIATQADSRLSKAKTTQSHYSKADAKESPPVSFEQYLEEITAFGKKLYGEPFSIYLEDHPVLQKLLIYFSQDKLNASRYGINLKKGVLLTGPIGCGKTSLMTIFRLMLPKERQFVVRSVREITFEFIRDGYSVIPKYSTCSYYQGQGTYLPKTYCFDDLGIESNIKYYGNETNVMGEILLSRYDLFIRQGMLTHATTNLSASELESIYGNRLRSRLREMVNLISFDEKSKDKRR